MTRVVEQLPMPPYYFQEEESGAGSALIPPRAASSPYDPRLHDDRCGYHCDQYPWECSCGAFGRKPPALWVDVFWPDPNPDLIAQLIQRGRAEVKL